MPSVALLSPVRRTLAAALRQRPIASRAARAPLAALALLLLLLALLLPASGMAQGYSHNAKKMPRAANPSSIQFDALPPIGQQVYRTIVGGGVFPYEKDGSVFGNRERILPLRKRGYYREYTVAPAHASSRGAKRSVCGGAITRPDVCYYSADHYQSFQKIIIP